MFQRLIILIIVLFAFSGATTAQNKRIDIEYSDTLIFKKRTDTLLICTDIEKISDFLDYIKQNAVKDKGENYKSFNFLYFYSATSDSKSSIEIFGDGFRYKGKRYKVKDLRNKFKSTFNYDKDIK